jgi:hypothetical protein
MFRPAALNVSFKGQRNNQFPLYTVLIALFTSPVIEVVKGIVAG